MSEEDVQKLLEGMEARLVKKMADSIPPSGSGLRGWKSAGLVLSVLTAVTVPVLGVTWYASNKMNQLEVVQKDVDRVRGEVGGLRMQIATDIAEVGTDIGELRKDVKLLREAFAAYTQVVLPMIQPRDRDESGMPFRLPPSPLPQVPRVVTP
jgi:hypothetical protein